MEVMVTLVEMEVQGLDIAVNFFPGDKEGEEVLVPTLLDLMGGKVDLEAQEGLVEAPLILEATASVFSIQQV